MTKNPLTPARALALALCALPLAWRVARAAPEEPGQAPAPTAEQASPTTPAETEKLGTVVSEQLAAQREATASQDRIDQLDDETQAMLSKYRQATAESESIRAYNEQLRVQIESQNQQIAEIEKELAEIETTSRDVLPVMQKMLDTLAEFVELDLPFLMEERRKRVAALQEVMPRADVTISEKYRRILEAYQIELEYGRTLEAYDGRVGGNGTDERTVQFLRVGRVALMYQTLDGRETGYWDADQKAWVVDDDYRQPFKEGLAVAKKIGAPDLLIVPVPAPKESKS
jgi:hypothetical protein